MQNHLVFGPLGRRIVKLAASPNGQFLAVHHVPQNYFTGDYHWSFFRWTGAGYIEAGTLPLRPDTYGEYGDSLNRIDVVALDDGTLVALESTNAGLYLTRYEITANGPEEVTRWRVGPVDASDELLRVLPSGREALVHYVSIDYGHSDWTGGPPPVHFQYWQAVDLATGKVQCETSAGQESWPPIAPALFSGSRGVSVIGALTALPWLEKRSEPERVARQERMNQCLGEHGGSALCLTEKHCLTRHRLIELATGAVLLTSIDEPDADRFGTPPGLHDLSPDENYVAATGDKGCFELWNVATRNVWRPELPAHGGVHTATFLPGGKVALGTAEGGVILVECAAGW